jgi:hypothetical protein
MLRVPGRRLAVAVGAAACLAGIVAGSASAATTVAVGDATLIGKVVAQVPVTVSCGPLDPFAVSGTVTVQQARNKQIAHGQAFYSAGQQFAGFGTPVPIVCDGTAQRFMVAVSADTSGPPFKTGTAVAAASVTLSDPATFQLVDSAATGAVEIRLR